MKSPSPFAPRTLKDLARKLTWEFPNLWNAKSLKLNKSRLLVRGVFDLVKDSLAQQVKEGLVPAVVHIQGFGRFYAVPRKSFAGYSHMLKLSFTSKSRIRIRFIPEKSFQDVIDPSLRIANYGPPPIPAPQDRTRKKEAVEESDEPEFFTPDWKPAVGDEFEDSDFE